MDEHVDKIGNKEIKELLISHGFYPDEQPLVKKTKSRANGEGSIRKKGNGYEGRITVGLDKNGKQIRKSVYASTRKECNEKMLTLKAEYKEKALPDYQEAPTLLEWLKIWLNEYKPDLAVSTRNRYNNIIEKIKESELAGKSVTDIAPLELQQFINELTSHEMCRRTIGMLSDSMAAALENGYISRNVAANLRNTIPTPEPKFEDSEKAFTVKEEKLFIQAIQSNPYKTLYLMSLYGGLRRGEACAMTWDCIDLNKSIMRVKEAATRSKDKGYVIGKTKTARAVRQVPLSVKLCEVLCAADQSGTYVFERNGKMLNPDILTMDFADIMKRLGMKHTLHQLRHTFATRCFEKGINVKVVQTWMGHVKSDMTLDTYTHASDEMMSTEAKKLD